MQLTYVIGTAETTVTVKIGKSNNPEDRLSTLQTGNSRELFIITATDSLEEKTLHQRYDQYRGRGEWFNLPLKIFLELIGECNKVTRAAPKLEATGVNTNKKMARAVAMAEPPGPFDDSTPLTSGAAPVQPQSSVINRPLPVSQPIQRWVPKPFHQPIQGVAVKSYADKQPANMEEQIMTLGTIQNGSQVITFKNSDLKLMLKSFNPTAVTTGPKATLVKSILATPNGFQYLGNLLLQFKGFVLPPGEPALMRNYQQFFPQEAAKYPDTRQHRQFFRDEAMVSSDVF